MVIGDGVAFGYLTISKVQNPTLPQTMRTLNRVRVAPTKPGVGWWGGGVSCGLGSLLACLARVTSTAHLASQFIAGNLWCEGGH